MFDWLFGAKQQDTRSFSIPSWLDGPVIKTVYYINVFVRCGPDSWLFEVCPLWQFKSEADAQRYFNTVWLPTATDDREYNYQVASTTVDTDDIMFNKNNIWEL